MVMVLESSLELESGHSDGGDDVYEVPMLNFHHLQVLEFLFGSIDNFLLINFY